MSLRNGYRAFALVMLALGVAPAIGQTPLGTPFTYQGNVRLAGEPLNASADLQFTLWDAATLGNQIGAMAAVSNVVVEEGLFTASIDFGAAAFDGQARWVEIAVRSPAGGVGAFTILNPRQAMTATPYALFSTAPWATNGNSIFNVNSGSVGIGTASPKGRLEVQGSVAATNWAEMHNQGAHLEWNRSGFAGETWLLNQRGQGSGGIRFGEIGADESITERMRIDAAGNVGIGNDGPSHKLTVQGGQNSLRLIGPTGEYQWGARLNFGDGNWAYIDEDTDDNLTISATRLQLTAIVGIGTDSPTQTLSVNGSAGKPGGGSWATFSDRRLKKNIQPLSGTLDKVLQLHGVSFEYTDPTAINELPGERIGMVAQQVEQVFPDWVEMTPAGYKSVTFRGFEALTVEALRDLRAEKDAEIAALRAENAELSVRLERLEKALEALTDGE